MKGIMVTCVGGLCDGQRVELDFEPADGSPVMVERLRPLGPPLNGDDPIPLNMGRLDIETQRYNALHFHVYGERFLFLVPPDANSADLMRRLASRYPKSKGGAVAT